VQSSRRKELASALVHCKAPGALKAIEEIAESGNRVVLDVLVQASLPGTIEFFQRLLKRPARKEWVQYIRGLAAAGGDRSIPLLLPLSNRVVCDPRRVEASRVSSG